MKLITLSLVIALTTLLGTVYGQSTTPNECNYPNVCYTVNQDKRCLEAFKINEDLNMLIDQQVLMMQASFYKNEELQEDNDKKDVKIKKKNKTIITLIGTTLLSLTIAILK